MRPDLEDFEELSDDAPRSRAMSWLLMVVAVGGFASLAYYAYHSGSQSMQDGQVLVVQADPSAIKETPVDAQGEEFPNQDKTIYDAIDPETAASNAGARIEKLLPEPEEPVIPEPAVEAPVPTKAATDTTTFVNKELSKVETPIDPVDAQSMKQPAPALAPESAAAPVAVAPVAPVVKAAAPKPVEAPKVVEAPKPATPAAPAMVNVKPAKPAPVVPKPAPAVASGNYKVQLGAYKSDAEARTLWSKISAKNSDVLKGSPIVVKAELPNGIFYRLRASGFASPEAAKAACAKLSSRGQACFYAGK